MILQLVPNCLSFNTSTLIQAFPDIFPSWQSRYLDSLEFFRCTFSPKAIYFFTVVDLVGCQIISLLGTNFKIN